MAKKSPRAQAADVEEATNSSTAQPGNSESSHVASSPFPIVGIGASAGGLAALQKMFAEIRSDSGLAYIIVQHLDPSKESLSSELIASHAKIPVLEVDDHPLVQPNTAYVIPPNKFLMIEGGRLKLTAREQKRGTRTVIDAFLRSLAEDQKQCAIAVILSGTGVDGTLGVKSVKRHGGLVIVQDPATAEHSGMPRSAMATGTADHILPLSRIPAALVNYRNHPQLLRSAPAEEAEPLREVGQKREKHPAAEDLDAILAVVRTHTKHDFRNYKINTLLRRTQRRMCLHHIDTLQNYLGFLREHTEEADALVKDLLISVTDFFRDGEAWDELATHVITPLVERKETDDPFRVWVPGCATGEEPYSIAMLVIEKLQQAQKSCPVQVFASDVDKDALDFARQGLYPVSIVADVSAARLKRFFVEVEGDHHYRVSKALREAVVFAEQNLIGDPPFSKLDLICCRNVLIYLKPEVQEKIITLYHFALRENGFLFLGNSETIGRNDDLFETISKRWRIYQRIGPPRHDRIEIPIASMSSRRNMTTPATTERQEFRLTNLAQQQLLNLLSPSAVLVDRSWQIRYICGDIDRYVTHSPGIPTDDLLAKARQGLRTKLRGAVHSALEQNQTVTFLTRIRRDGDFSAVKVIVHPLKDRENEQELALVIFEDDIQSGTALKPLPTPVPDPEIRSSAAEIDDEVVIRQLEDELAATKEDLHASIEQLETSNEEYKAANEEIMSINEELQSTNEELETSKEELQSLNEELTTVNNQLSAKVDELETKQEDLNNLLVATDVATICLDTNLKIRWFTPVVTRLIRLTESDKGRPLSDFAHDFAVSDLEDLSEQVLRQLMPSETEVGASDDRTFLRRISPYRTEAHRIGGVVITFVDITQRKRSESALNALKNQLADELDDMQRLHEISVRNIDGEDFETFLEAILAVAVRISDANLGTIQLLDRANGGLQIVAQHEWQQEFLAVFPHGEPTAVPAMGRSFREGRRFAEPNLGDTKGLDQASAEIYQRMGVKAVQATPLKSRVGQVLGIISTHYRAPFDPSAIDFRRMDLLARQASDLIERAQLEAARKESEERLRVLVDAAAQAIWETDCHGVVVDDSPTWRAFTGQTFEERVGYGWLNAVHPDDRASVEREWRESVANDAFVNTEFRLKDQSRGWRWTNVRAAPIRDISGQVRKWVAMNIDVTELRQAEMERARLEERYRTLFNSIDEGFCLIEVLFDGDRQPIDIRFLQVNPAFHRQTGLQSAQGHSLRELLPGEDRSWVEAYGEVAVTGTPVRFTDYARDLRRWYDVYAFRVGTAEQHQVAVLFNDVSQRVEAQEAIRESRSRLQLALDSANLANWEVDLQTGALQASTRHRDFLGLPIETPMTAREDWVRHVLSEDRNTFYGNQQRAIDSGASAYKNEYRIRKVDGQIHTMASQGIIIRDSVGDAIRIVGVTADVTEQRESEANQRAFTQSLETQVAARVELFEILRDVAIIANQAITIEEAMSGAMERISSFDGWILSHFHRLDEKTHSAFIPSNIWYVHPDELADEETRVQIEEFQANRLEAIAIEGTDWITGVAHSGQPVFLDDLNLLRGRQPQYARALGLKVAMAFPVLVENEVCAVIEFYSREESFREKTFLELMHNIGIQLGHVVERKRLEEAVTNATHEQQRHFGRELHDSIAQQLTGLTMMAQTLQEKLQQTTPDFARDVSTLVTHLKRSHEQVRRLSRGLRPVELDGEGLVQALRDLLEVSHEMYGVPCELQSPETIDLPDEDKRTHLYRITQEAIQNAAKHGKPQKITVTLREFVDAVELTMADDGIGFDTSARLTTGSGLRIMKYRADLVGGTLAIESKPGKGTVLKCWVPKPLQPFPHEESSPTAR